MVPTVPRHGYLVSTEVPGYVHNLFTVHTWLAAVVILSGGARRLTPSTPDPTTIRARRVTTGIGQSHRLPQVLYTPDLVLTSGRFQLTWITSMAKSRRWKREMSPKKRETVPQEEARCCGQGAEETTLLPIIRGAVNFELCIEINMSPRILVRTQAKPHQVTMPGPFQGQTGFAQYQHHTLC